jgi:hypothetical protein
MRRMSIIAAAFAVIFLGTAGACGYTPPCQTLPPPSPASIQSAAEGNEVEREVGSAECVVVGNVWVPQAD